MMLYAVIDTNVLVSALLSDKEDTATVLVVKEVIKGNIIPIYSYEIVNEYRNVLNRRKFNFSKDKINLLLDAIYSFGILFEPEPFSFSLPDIKDLPFYIIVVQTQDKKSFLVT